MPVSIQTPASTRLLARDNAEALKRTGFRLSHRFEIGGIDRIEVKNLEWVVHGFNHKGTKTLSQLSARFSKMLCDFVFSWLIHRSAWQLLRHCRKCVDQ